MESKTSPSKLAAIDEIDSLAAIAQELNDTPLQQDPVAQEAPEMSPEQQIQADVLAAFNNRADRPSPEQILEWKNELGAEGVQLLSLDSENVYIFTYLKAKDWNTLQSSLRMLQQQSPEKAFEIENKLKKAVVKQSLLWPAVDKDFFENCRAGLIDTLYNQILLHSYFISPAQASMLTVSL